LVVFLILFVALGRLYLDMLKKPETRALLFMAALVLLIGVAFYTRVEGWSLIDAIYFCVVTLGTVGYGDITPTTDAGKIFTTVYILLGLGIIGGFFATLGQLVSTRGLLPLRDRAQEIVGRTPADAGGDSAGSGAG
jgi:voltage-gated potassium channel Kch